MIEDEIIELLKSTDREGINELIEYMDENGFFTAPCSGQYHLCKEGGLAEHSLNVYKAMTNFTFAVYGENMDATENGYDFLNSVIITSLLHDLGKMGQFGKPNYIENILKSGKRSDNKPYETNKELLHVPHEIRSIQIAAKFIELTEQEQHAILYHNSLYGELKYSINGKETPLQLLLHFSDLWCARVTEI
mgnify:CR=1 FL=1